MLERLHVLPHIEGLDKISFLTKLLDYIDFVREPLDEVVVNHREGDGVDFRCPLGGAFEVRYDVFVVEQVGVDLLLGVDLAVLHELAPLGELAGQMVLDGVCHLSMLLMDVEAAVAEKLFLLQAVKNGLLLGMFGALVLLLDVGSSLPLQRLSNFLPN